jgi:hypothetical protein
LESFDTGAEGVGEEFEIVGVLPLSDALISKEVAQKGKGVFDVIGEVAVGQAHDVVGRVAVVRIVGGKRFLDGLHHV